MSEIEVVAPEVDALAVVFDGAPYIVRDEEADFFEAFAHPPGEREGGRVVDGEELLVVWKGLGGEVERGGAFELGIADCEKSKRWKIVRY